MPKGSHYLNMSLRLHEATHYSKGAQEILSVSSCS